MCIVCFSLRDPWRLATIGYDPCKLFLNKGSIRIYPKISILFYFFLFCFRCFLCRITITLWKIVRFRKKMDQYSELVLLKLARPWWFISFLFSKAMGISQRFEYKCMRVFISRSTLSLDEASQVVVETSPLREWQSVSWNIDFFICFKFIVQLWNTVRHSLLIESLSTWRFCCYGGQPELNCQQMSLTWKRHAVVVIFTEVYKLLFAVLRSFFFYQRNGFKHQTNRQ